MTKKWSTLWGAHLRKVSHGSSLYGMAWDWVKLMWMWYYNIWSQLGHWVSWKTKYQTPGPSQRQSVWWLKTIWSSYRGLCGQTSKGANLEMFNQSRRIYCSKEWQLDLLKTPQTDYNTEGGQHRAVIFGRLIVDTDNRLILVSLFLSPTHNVLHC